MPRRGTEVQDVDYIAGEAARKSPIKWLVVTGILVVLAIATGTALVANSLRERALQAEHRSLANTAVLLSKHFDQQIEEFNDVPEVVLRRLEVATRSGAEAFSAELSTLEVHEILRVGSTKRTDATGINVFDAQGQLVNSSERWPARSLDISDRMYFKTLRDRPNLTNVIEMVRDRFTERWIIVLARRVPSANGEFFGVIGRALDPRQIEEFFASFANSPGSSIGLFHTDGTLLARYPYADEKIGLNFATGPIHRELLSKGRAGTRELTSRLDGVVKIAAARPLDLFPLSVVATTDTAAALSDWRDQTQLLIVVASGTAAAIAVTILLIVRRLSRQNRIAREQLDTALNNITQGLMLYDASSRIVLFNQRYIEMYGLSCAVVQPGRYFRDVMKHRKATGSFDGDPDKYCDDILRIVKIGKLTRRFVTSRSGRTIQLVNQPLPGGGWVTTHEDITELRQSEQRIEHLAHYDSLTNLPNRNLFREHLKRQTESAGPEGGFALLYIDIDQFKEVNDTLGHAIGDEFLVAVADRLRACIADRDFAARLGGDEFAVILHTNDAAEVADFVARLYLEIRRPHQCSGHQLTADASIGAALAPQHGSDMDDLIRKADLAMYAAKSSGRRSLCFFNPEMEATATAHRQLARDLREAINSEAFDIHYQPVVDLKTNAITGCEALLRWTHPVRGVISPADFIPVAEDTGLIVELGNWVLEKACAEAATWPDHIKLAVNVSPIQFRSPTLGLKVAQALARSGLSAGRLELEITEAVLIRDDETTLATLHQLRALGARIALDDFGTGYSSLSYLQRFPFDKVKIDRSFVRDMSEGGGSSSIVKAVVMIADGCDMVTTAEGVEEEWQREALKKLGCTQMQGWLFSKAKPAAEIRTQLFGVASQACA